MTDSARYEECTTQYRVYGLLGPSDVAIKTEWLDEASALAARDRLDEQLGPEITQMVIEERPRSGDEYLGEYE